MHFSKISTNPKTIVGITETKLLKFEIFNKSNI